MADTCPDYFRFVDFGQKDVDGLARGGALIRIESLNGRPLLKRPETACSDAQFLASDGHGNPIPVVTSVTFDPQKLPFSATAFSLRRVEDAISMAEDSATPHRNRLALSTTLTAQGENHLCAGTAEAVSCQVVSPYVPQAPLVVQCQDATCEMSSLLFNGHIVASAEWRMFPNDLETIGREVARKVQEITEFLDTQH